MLKDKPILLLALGQLFIWAGIYYVFPAMLVRWEISLGWSKADLTGAITLAIFASAFAAPTTGRLIDAGKGPQVMGISALVAGCVLALVSFTESLWQFYCAWGLIGVCFAGCLYEPCFAIVTRSKGSEAKKAIILISLIAGFAGSISFPMVYTLAEAYNWQITLRIFSGFIILIAAPLLWFGATTVEHNSNPAPLKKQPKSRALGLMKSKTFWLLGIAFGLIALVHGVALHHLLPILNERGVAAETAVLAASFIGPMQVAGRLAMVAAEKHVSNNGIAVACFVVLGCAIALLSIAGTNPALLVAFVILFGGGYGIVSIIRPVIARDILGQENFGAKSGALALLYLIGSGSAPFLGALIWQLGGYQIVLNCLIGLSVIGLSLYWFASKKGQ